MKKSPKRRPRSRTLPLMPLPELTLRLVHIKLDPVRTAFWIRRKLGAAVTERFRDALNQALAEPE